MKTSPTATTPTSHRVPDADYWWRLADGAIREDAAPHSPRHSTLTDDELATWNRLLGGAA